MKMHLMTAVLGAVLAGSVVTAFAAEHPMAAKPALPEQKAAMTQAVFVCPDCHTLALKAGKCSMCEKDLKAMHLLGTKDGQGMMCDCATDCKCDATGMKDGKCACGKEVKTMSCKGLYVCEKGCPELSDKAGKCACGMEMKKVE